MALSSDTTSAKLDALRALLRAENAQAVILSKGDAHCMEYARTRDNEVYFVSGFDGSAALGAVSVDAAAVFTDGRYQIQVRQQVDLDHFEVNALEISEVAAWLGTHIGPKGRVLVGAGKVSVRTYRALQEALSAHHLRLVPAREELCLTLWHDRPVLSPEPIVAYPEAFSGQARGDKIAHVQAELQRLRCDGTLLNSLESIAWLFNIRAPERPNTPVPEAYAFVPGHGKAVLWLHQEALDPELEAQLRQDCVLVPYSHFHEGVSEYIPRGRIAIDHQINTYRDYLLLQDLGATVVDQRDLTLMAKACKNTQELAGARQAHLMDAIALCDTLCWIDAHVGETPASSAGEGVHAAPPLTELAVIEYLTSARARHDQYRGPSFDAISGAGPNGAIVHYRATPETNRTLRAGELFLLDSGGQYDCGTTDVTRTIVLGKQATQVQQLHYTLVLKGHLALMRQRFPRNTPGPALDSIARQYLWMYGLDYAHGTGHGVGAFLGVHEGPQSISPRHNTVALEPGMILSNEPGYYQEGAHGIRIENLLYVKACVDDFLAFETLTLVPYARELIDTNLLTRGEVEQINLYHQHVLDTLWEHVGPEVQAWLSQACQPLRVTQPQPGASTAQEDPEVPSR